MAILAALLFLFVLPALAIVPAANAVTTTNCSTVSGVPTATCSNAGGNAATAIANERKVFYASGYWWIFWAQGTAIDYQYCQGPSVTSCSTSSAWSAAAVFTSVGSADSANGQGFSMWQSGNDLVYAVAPSSALTTTFYWGVVQLNAGSITWLAQDEAYSFKSQTTHAGSSVPRMSVALDANNYLWVAIVTTAGGAYYQDIYECANNVITNPTACSSATWYTTFTLKLASTSTTYLTNPTLLPVTNAGTNYMTLTYENVTTAGTGGPIDIDVSTSGAQSSNSILWQATCGSGSTAVNPEPCTTAAAPVLQNSFSSGGADGIYYSAASSGATVYIVSSIAGIDTASVSYTEGQTVFAGYDAFLLGTNTNPTLSISGSVAVMTFATGSSVDFYWSSLSSIVSGADGWTGPTYLAYASEVSPSWADASVASYTVGSYNLIGVIWENTVTNPTPQTDRIRFAVESISNTGVVNFPVSLTLSLYEYTSPTSANFQASPTNYFTINYAVCAESGCTGNGTYQYRSSTGAPLTITNVQSYSTFTISDQTSASTSAEKWCLLLGSSCSSTAVSTYGASDELTQSLYYYDQLAQPNLYAIATSSVFSVWATATSMVATVNYDTVTSTATGFVLYPNSQSAQPFIQPRADLYASGALDESANWVRTRDVLPGCTSQTIYPDSSGSTCAPSVSFGTLTGGPLTVNYPTVTTLPTGILEYVPLAVTNTQATATSSGFQQMFTINSATFSQYEALNLQNVEFFTATGTVLPSWLESGNLNTDTSSVYWVNLGTNTIAAGATATIYMGFAATTTNLFTSPTGAVGEAPTLSPTYGEYDNGALVFTTYWNFAGTALPAGWTAITGTGYIVNNGITFTGAGTTVLETTAASYPDTAITESNFQVPNNVNYAGVMLVKSSTGGQYTTANWETVGNGAGQAANGFDIDAYTTAFKSFASGVATSIPSTVTPADSSYIAGGTVNGGDTIEYVNELPSKTASDITTNVPSSGNYYVAAGDLNTQFLTFNWIRQRAYAPNGVMPTVAIGPVTPAAGGSAEILAYAPITLTNSNAEATPSFFQADVNVTSNSPSYFSGTTSSVALTAGVKGVTSTGTNTTVLQQTSASWTTNQWAGFTLTYTTGPAAGQSELILSNTANTITTAAFSPAPTAAGGDGFTVLPLSVLTDSGATWTASEWVGDYLEYTSGPASGQSLQISASTATTITTVGFNPSPTPAGGNTFVINSGFQKYESSTLQNVEFFVCSTTCATSATLIPSWLESGSSNTASDSVYWVNLPSSIAASGGTLTIYIGFASTSTDLFGSTGYVGEAPELSTSYGANDNGAVVFNLYDNFAGSSLSSQWAPTATITNDEGVSQALGQLGLTTNYQNEQVSTVTPSELNNPSDAVMYGGDLWVVDSGNNRILEFTAPFTTGEAPSIVIGQTGFGTNTAAVTQTGLNDPRAIAFDSSGNLWVADTGNNRILEFTAPFSDGEAASTVLGQASYTANTATISATNENTPRALAFDSAGDLWVADSGNNRVIKYATPLTSDEAATVALGQTSLTANGAAATTAGESGPSGLAFSGANLWVSDTGNNRVLEYLSSLTTGEAATLAIGQTSLTTGSANQGAAFPTATTLDTPVGIAFDSSGNLWVADSGNNRVLEYPKAGFATGETATVVIGQSGFTGSATAASASGENVPRAVAFDSSGNLWVTDADNSRVTEVTYSSGFTTGEAASMVIGQPGFSDTPNALNLYDPTSAAFDSSGNLWVVDSGNNRILEYLSNGYQFYTGESASLVIGQGSLKTNAAGTGSTTLNDPTYIAFDSSGNLWVADAGNNRILEFTAPFTTGESASLVIGQASLTTGAAATTATGLNNPREIAFDSSGDLWVADTGNNRVLEYAPTFSTGEAATIVLGQPNFTTGTVNTGGISASSLNTPYGVAFSSGDIWVADTGNNRILEYTPALATDEAATVVLGQDLFTTAVAATSQAALREPTGISFDYWGDLWVADTGNNRVLEYAPTYNSIFSGMPASGVEDGSGYASIAANLQVSVTSTTLNEPFGVTFDPLGNLWIADSGNNRVTASGTGSIVVNNGVTIRQTTNYMGVISRATINPQTNILEIYGYFSSTSSTTQVFGYNTPTATTPTPTPNTGNNRLYSIGTASSLFEIYDGTSAATTISADTIPATAPQVTYLEADSAQTGVPVFYPATTTTVSATASMTLTSQNPYWALRNSTITMVNSIPGQPNERWAAAQNNLGWTLNSAFQVTPALPYYHQYQDTFVFKSGGLVTSIAPGISFTLYGTEFGSQNFPISTFTSSDPSQSWYVDAGTVVTFPAAGVGAASGTRWENSNNQSQTVIANTPGDCTTLCTATYFEQYEQYLEYSTNDHSVLPSGVTPQMNYTSFLAVNTINIPTSTTTIWIDALTTSTVTHIINASTPYDRWTVPSYQWTITCSNTVGTCVNEVPSPSIVYYHQFEQEIVNYQTSDDQAIPAGTTPSAPTISYTTAGSPISIILNATDSTFVGTTTAGTTASDLQDTTATWNVNQWVGYTLVYTSGPAIGESAIITANNGDSVTTAGAFSPAPTSGGGNTFKIVYLTWMDSSTEASITQSLTDGANQRWVPDAGDGADPGYGVWTIAGTNCAGVTCDSVNPGQGIFGPFSNATILYDHQYDIVFETIPPASPGYPLSVLACPELTTNYCNTVGVYTDQNIGVPVWETTPVMIQESGNSTLIPAGFSTTSDNICFFPGTSCLQATGSGTVLTTLSGSGTINAIFEVQEGITFVQTGIPSGSAQWSVAVYCQTVVGCPAGTLEKAGASTSSALLIDNIPYGTYTFVVASPVANGADNERFFATPTTGSATISLANPAETVPLSFSVQYKLVAISDPLWTSTITANYVNGTSGPGSASSQSELSIWLVPGATATLSAVVNPAQFSVQPTWIQWTDTGQCVTVPTAACENELGLGVIINAPDTETANFGVGMGLQIVPSAESAFAGESVQTTVWVFGGIGTGTVSINPTGLPAGVTVAFYICDPSCGSSSPNTMNFQTSTEPANGQGIEMQVTVAADATIYGAFLIPVTVSYGGAAGQPGGMCGTAGQPACLTYTLDIITPQAKVLGVSNAYGITTSGQTTLVYATPTGSSTGYWFAFYMGQSELVYNYSADGSTWSPGGIVPLGMIPPGVTDTGVQGYSFAVTSNGANEIYYVLTSTNNDTTGTAKPGNYFYWNYGAVQADGLVAWANPINAYQQPLCLAAPCTPTFGAGQPAMLLTNYGGISYLEVAIPVLTDTSQGWLMQLWENPLNLGTPSTWVNVSPASPVAGVLGIPARTNNAADEASSVNMKLLALTDGAVALVDWVGNTPSEPSVEVFNTGSATFDDWAGNLPSSAAFQYSCTPESASEGGLATSYVLYGQQSDAVTDGNNVIYFAGEAGAGALAGQVVYYAFTYNVNLPTCAGSYTIPSVVSGTSGGIPNTPVPGQPWHITLAYTSGGMTLGFGEGDILGSAIGSCSLGTCSWVVLPDSVDKVSGLTIGLTSVFSQATGNIGTVWVETSATSPTGYVVAFALI